MTLPLNTEGSAEFSIFLASIRERMRTEGAALRVNGSGLVQVVVHPRSHRGDDNHWISSIPASPILLDTPREDWMYDPDAGERDIDTCSKLGGRPHIYRDIPQDGLRRLDEDGFIHVLQVEIDAQPDTMTGEWPFLDAIFNLFVRPRMPFGWEEWRWLWQL